MTTIIIPDRNNDLAARLNFDANIRSATQKIKDTASSPVAIGQLIIGIGLGMQMRKIYVPLTNRIINTLCPSLFLACPFSSLGLGCKILFTPVVCILSPMAEEIIFSGYLQPILKTKIEPLFARLGFLDSVADVSARVMSVFFTTVTFGIVHFSNALFMWCNPIIFLPQVIATIFMGLMFGLAKEFSGGLLMPIGMHIGNNTMAWVTQLLTP